MRKAFAILLCISLYTVSYGRIVGQWEARSFAEEYLGSHASLSWSAGDGDGAKVSSADAPAFYVFQSENEWVIISGDDIAVPVLAHGEGRFPFHDGMPANMRAYLDGLGSQILRARTENLHADSRTKWQWEHISSLRAATKAGNGTKGPLTADIKWTQDSPFNGLTPTFSGSHAPAGCVATAMAIVLRYHRWPETGKGVIPAYTTRSQKIKIDEINIDGYKYDWSKMPLSFSKSSTAEEKEAVANLLLHIGAMVKMDYESGSSGAYPSDILPALTKYMSYKKSAAYLYAADYSHDEWFAMIKREIDADRPVIYGASSATSGHCMVCDGYDESTRMISVNWGWGAGGRGWYVLNTMNGIHQGWPVEHDAIFGLEPDRDGDSSPAGRIAFRQGTGTKYGFQLDDSCTDIRKDGVFTLRFDKLYNRDTLANIQYKCVLYDRDNREKETLVAPETIDFKDSNTNKIASYVTRSISCSIKGDCVIGDKIKCMHRLGEGYQWLPVGRWTMSWYTNEAKAMYEMGAYDLDIIALPSSMKPGQVFYPQFLYGGHKAYKTVVWYYDGEAMEERFPSVILEEGRHTVKAVVTYVDDTVRTIEAEFEAK
ncbi:MAG: C10 family peptidase [Bacteroidales bacterium]|nr:C10 family peptidase [Candidatus Cacconaster merdequi]